MQRATGVKRAIRVFAAAAGAASALAGCAMFDDKQATPAWYKERAAQLKKQPYPKLAAVPTPTPSSRTMEEWAAVQRDVEGAGRALAASPRSAPAAQAPQATSAIDAKAREAAAPALPER